MGVKPVEYKRDSSTQGFAVAGDKKDITKTTANTIKKDVDQGNVNNLDNAQSRALESNVDYDTIEYSADENKNVGKNQIDTTAKDGEDLSEKDGKAGGASSGVTAAATAAGMAAAATIMVTTKGVKTAADLGKHIPGGMLAAGIVAAAGGAAVLTLSFEGIFDPNIGERKNQTSQAESNNQMIQQYYDELTSNMDSMDADSAKYAELCDLQLQADVSLIDEIGTLQAQIIEYQAQGNTEMVAQLQKQIEDLKKGAEEDTGTRDEMSTYKENIELYASRNAEAQGVSESGSTVSDFLKDGNPMQNWAKAAEIASYVGVAAMAVGVAFAAIRMGKDLAGIFTAPFASVDNAGMVMFVAGGILMGLAAKNFAKNASNEGAAADAGNQMGEYVAALNENIDAQAGYTEETSAGYAAADGAAAEEVGKTQEGVDDANKNLAQSLAVGKGDGSKPDNPTAPVSAPPTGAPTVGDNPEDKPKPNEGGMAA